MANTICGSPCNFKVRWSADLDLWSPALNVCWLRAFCVFHNCIVFGVPGLLFELYITCPHHAPFVTLIFDLLTLNLFHLFHHLLVTRATFPPMLNFLELFFPEFGWEIHEFDRQTACNQSIKQSVCFVQRAHWAHKTTTEVQNTHKNRDSENGTEIARIRQK